MKKAVAIFALVGLGLVGLAYYFSLESHKLIEQKEEADHLNQIVLENKMTADEAAREELLYGNTVIYQSIDFSKPDYSVVSPCMQRFQATGELDALCLNKILDVVVDDFGEQGFINAIIGSSIDYDNLSLDHTFLDNLFKEQTSLPNKLVLGFLNKYRNPSRLQEAFDAHKQDLFNNVPKNLYQKFFEEQITECLSAYEEIAGQNNKEAFFEDIYFKADTQNLHDQYWKYTFWKRRAIEKNDEVLYTILSEIKAYYNDQ
ncbi:MAG: hypothetical protein GYB37_05035 [Algicola sp.]|nr:hypothetical protein [Algicola sp.]